MTVRPSVKTIPSAFTLFDSQVSAEDAFLNARDMLVFRQNNNILLAERTRKMLCTVGAFPTDIMSGTPISIGNPEYFLAVPVRFSSRFVRRVTVHVRAQRDATTSTLR